MMNFALKMINLMQTSSSTKSPQCEWVVATAGAGSCEVATSDPHRMIAVRMTAAAATDNAVCLDGSAATFYYRAGTGTGGDKWYV